jgi:flagellar biosynthetic protein FliP
MPSRGARAAGLLLALAAGIAGAQEAVDPAVPLDFVSGVRTAMSPENIMTPLTVVFLITVLSLAPAILVMTTSFTRIIVVLGFLRQAMATQQTPPNQVLIGLALFLTFFIMWPTYERVNSEAIQPYIRGEIATPEEAIAAGMEPMREFMFRQTRPKDLKLFLGIAGIQELETREDVPTHVLVPAFVVSELTTAFQIGFIIYIPFLIIDMVVASTLMAMGMMMLPPIFVSLPFKIIMFVLADGWHLLLGSLVRSFQ